MGLTKVSPIFFSLDEGGAQANEGYRPKYLSVVGVPPSCRRATVTETQTATRMRFLTTICVMTVLCQPGMWARLPAPRPRS
ncbi:MAG: hypothetical protein Q4C87_04310 [Actinomycetaceae bacterium]|nr:hypothetical protein [Actinomycetaceae bacterium]